MNYDLFGEAIQLDARFDMITDIVDSNFKNNITSVSGMTVDNKLQLLKEAGVLRQSGWYQIIRYDTLGEVDYIYTGSSISNTLNRMHRFFRAVFEEYSNGDPPYRFSDKYRNLYGKNIQNTFISFFFPDSAILGSIDESTIRLVERELIRRSKTKYGSAVANIDDKPKKAALSESKVRSRRQGYTPLPI